MKLDLKQPHTRYYASDGTLLSGVTTICGVLAKPHLLGWYAEMEREGVLSALAASEDVGDLNLAEIIRHALPRRANGKPLPFAEIKRDRAADLGTITHARCHAHDIGEELERDGLPSDLYEQSQHGLDRYIAWVAEQGFILEACEKKVVYETKAVDWRDVPPRVAATALSVPSESVFVVRNNMRYGGTIDRLFGDVAGRKVLVDLKTSKRSQYWPYDETFAQVCAYAEAEGGVDRIIVVRIGKEPGDEIQVHELTADERRHGWRLFCGAYEAFEAKKALAGARK